MNLQAVHYLVIVLSGLAAGLPSLGAYFPSAATYLAGAGAVCAMLAGILGIFSPSAIAAPSAAARKVPPLGVLLALSLVGCTAAQANAVLADIGAIGGAAQLPCAIVTAVDGSAAGQVCGAIAGDVSAVAGLIQSILKSLPASAAAATNLPPVVWGVGSTQVTLRPDLAPLVKAAAKKGATK